MSQSRKGSAAETAASTAIGFLVSWVATLVVLPWFGLHPSPADGFAITAIYTALSLARGYLVRRWFNRLGAARAAS